VTPFAVWMLKGFFDAVPVECDEAALIDGASRLAIIRLVVVPMAWPGVIVAAVFCFILAWNEFIFALILTQNVAAQTLPIVISGFVMDFTTSFSFINAAGVIAIVPPVILAMLFERYIVSGLTAGAVKG